MVAINYNGLRIFQYFAMISSCLNIISSGLHCSWTAPMFPKLLDQNSEIQLTDDQASWVASIYLIGGVVGSFTSGIIINHIGRKNLILLGCLPFIVSWLMLAFGRSFDLIATARFIAGLSDGFVFCSIPLYLAEIADPEIRGFLSSFTSVCVTFGNLLMNVLGSYLNVTTSSLISLFFPIMCFLTFIWIPESPYNLLMKGKIDEARKSLQFFKNTDNVENELERLNLAVQEHNANASKRLHLFTDATNRKALFIVLGVRLFHQLSGVMPLIFYSQTIFAEAGDYFSPVIASTVYFTLQTLSSAVCSLLIDKFGRRPLVIFAMLGIIISLLVIGSFFYVKTNISIGSTPLMLIPVFALYVFVIASYVGLQAMPLLLVGELFPTNVKAFAFSLHEIAFAALSVVALKLFQLFNGLFGIYAAFYFFAGASVVGLIFMVKFIPETKGQTLEDIQKSI